MQRKLEKHSLKADQTIHLLLTINAPSKMFQKGGDFIPSSQIFLSLKKTMTN